MPLMAFSEKPFSVSFSWLLFSCALILLGCHCSYYWPFFSDDALISLRYADRLVDGLGLTWTAGERVEGYSNLLWVLLTAGLHYLGMDLIVAARMLGFLGSSMVVAALIFGNRPITSDALMWRGLAVGAFVASGPVAIWTIGGLETMLFAGLIAIAIILSIRLIQENHWPTASWLALVLGLLCITRPDGPLICVAIACAIPSGRLVSASTTLKVWKLLCWVSILPILLYGGQLFFRIWYYGEWLPNTALIKLSPSGYHFLVGGKYLLKFFATISVLLIAVGIPLFSQRKNVNKLRSFFPLLLISTLWGSYIMLIGGDYFPGFRQAMPLLVVVIFLNREIRDSWFRMTFSPWMIVLFVLIFMVTQSFFPENERAKTERWEWDSQVLAYALVDQYGDKYPLIAVTAAGSIPYWTGFDAIDLHGLNDYYLPRHKPDDYENTRVGHGLSDPSYVLSRQPDIVIFDAGNPNPSMGPGRDLLDTPAFLDEYFLVEISGNSPYEYKGKVWIRKGF